jgi:hypothetical protein
VAAHADFDVAFEGAFFIEGEPADAGFDGVSEAGLPLAENAKVTASVDDETNTVTFHMEGDGIYPMWYIPVDGKEVTITPVGNALVAFNLDKGEHTIKLEYYPKGFAMGLTVTIICAATFAFLCVWTYIIKKRRKKKGDISENPEEVQINAE